MCVVPRGLVQWNDTLRKSSYHEYNKVFTYMKHSSKPCLYRAIQFIKQFHKH